MEEGNSDFLAVSGPEDSKTSWPCIITPYNQGHDAHICNTNGARTKLPLVSLLSILCHTFIIHIQRWSCLQEILWGNSFGNAGYLLWIQGWGWILATCWSPLPPFMRGKHMSPCLQFGLSLKYSSSKERNQCWGKYHKTHRTPQNTETKEVQEINGMRKHGFSYLVKIFHTSTSW